MVSRHEVGALRNTHVGAYGHFARIVDSYAFAQPEIVARLEVPQALREIFHLTRTSFRASGHSQGCLLLGVHRS